MSGEHDLTDGCMEASGKNTGKNGAIKGHLEVLRKIHDRMAGTGINWAVTGSLGFALDLFFSGKNPVAFRRPGD